MRRRLLRRSLLFFAVLLPCLWIFRNRVLAPLLAPLLEKLAAQALGGELEIGRLGGDWWSFLEIEDLRTTKPHDATPLRRAEVRFLRLEYALGELLRGEDGWLRSVSAAGVTLEVDAGAAQGPEQPRQAAAAAPAPPQALPRVAVADLSVRILGDGWEIQAGGGRLATLQESGQPGAELTVASARGTAASMNWTSGPMRASVHWSETAVDGDLQLAELHASGDLGRLHLAEARAQAAFHDGELAGVELFLSLAADLSRPWDLPGLDFLPPCQLRASTDVQWRSGAALDLAAQLHGLHFSAEGRNLALSRPARLRYDGTRRQAEIEDLAVGMPGVALEVQGTLPLDLAGEELLSGGSLNLAVAAAEIDGAALAAAAGTWVGLPWQAGRGTANCRLEGSWSSPAIHFTAELSDLLPAVAGPAFSQTPWRLELAASGAGGVWELDRAELRSAGLSASARGSCRWPLDFTALERGAPLAAPGDWSAELVASTADAGGLAELIPGAPPLAARVDATLAAGGVVLRQGRVESAVGTLDFSGELPWDLERFQLFGPGAVDLDIEIDGLDLARGAALFPEAPELPIRGGSVQGKLRCRGSWAAPEIELELQGSSLAFALPPDVPPLGPASLAVQARYSAARGGELHRLNLRSAELELDASGAWQGTLDVPGLLAGGAFDPGQLAARGKLQVADLSWLERLPFLRRCAGRLEAQIEASGPPAALEVTGSASLAGGELRLQSPGAPPLERLALHATFDRREVRLESLQGELGAAPFRASGRVWWDGADGPGGELELQGRDLLLVRQDGLRIRADADLNLQASGQDLRLAGVVLVTDGRFSKSVDFLALPASLRRPATPGAPGGLQLFSLAPPLDRLRFDVEMRTAGAFRVRNNVVDGTARSELRLTGSGELPALRGEVYLDPTDVKLPANTIRVERGVLRFLESNPYVPELDLYATLRRYGYDVVILVNGPLDAPVVTMSSTPPLNAEQLLLLVTTNTLPQEDLDAEETLNLVAVYLARDLVRALFGDQSAESEESLLSRIEVETGRDASSSGEETIEGRFLLLRDVLTPGDALYLEGEKDGYGDFNLGLKIRFRFP